MPRLRDSDSDDSRLIVSRFLDSEAEDSPDSEDLDSPLIHRRRFSDSDSDDNPLIRHPRFSDSDDDDCVPLRFKRPRLVKKHRQSEGGEEEEIQGKNKDYIDFEAKETNEHRTGYRNPNIVVTLSDPGLLDCPICFEPLTVPVFQCDGNGHLACSSCCAKIENKCPSCSCPIGSNRCSAIEKVVDSSTTSCRNKKYGCAASVTYHKKNEHERTCAYSPSCSCPYLGCEFVSSVMELYRHYSNNHGDSAIEFVSDNLFSISLRKYDKFVILRERDVGTLFILHNSVDDLGNVVSLSCIQPIFKEGFIYKLVVRHRESDSLKLRSVTQSIRSLQAYPRPPSFLLIPREFFSLDSNCGHLEMDVHIYMAEEEHDRF
ncbi:putative E3 ubiquitin-protein ligase SINA-like 6 [Rosa chinensis]|nr:putative E3 ubiquitin-protein ligase SINA-like 6 [Rosa chinensis]